MQKMYSLDINWKSIERKHFTFLATQQNRHEWKGRTCNCGCGFEFQVRDWFLIDDSMSFWCPMHFCLSPQSLRIPREWEFKKISCKKCLYKETDISECPNTFERTRKWNLEDLSDVKILLNASTTHGFHGDITPEKLDLEELEKRLLRDQKTWLKTKPLNIGLTTIFLWLYHGPHGMLSIMFCKSFKKDSEIPLELVRCRGDKICEV